MNYPIENLRSRVCLSTKQSTLNGKNSILNSAQSLKTKNVCTNQH